MYVDITGPVETWSFIFFYVSHI